MPLDREDTLKKAEKLLRQGRLDNAIAEYLRVVEDQPRDWNTANTLGDLYARASQPAKAVAQYARIAEHFFQDGFYPKAAALYKKILKLVPDEEAAQLQLADISVRLGLLKDAKTYYGAVATRRRARGDSSGANEIVVLLGTVDPSDFDARTAAARVLAEAGDDAGAAAKYREIYSDLLEKGREAAALQALSEAVRLNPADKEGRTLLARGALAAGDAEGARAYLDRETAGDDPALLLALADVELRAGDGSVAREILSQLLARDPALRDEVVAIGWALCGTSTDAAFVCADAAVDVSIAKSEFDRAAVVLQSFIGRVPGHIPSLLKLVEVCVDGGLEETMYETQAQLADAYLSTSQAAEARVIAEDLVAREPWESAHIERFRRALVMLRVSEPDSVIAERLSGQSPFMATDHFSDPTPEPVVAAAAEEPAPAAAAPATSVASAPTAPVVAHAPAPIPPPPSAAMNRAPEPWTGASTATAPGAGKLEDTVEIDLTGFLGAMEALEPAAAQPPAPAPPESLDEVFKDFRSDAGRKVAADQSAQHMKLGRTYLEMGMLEEAAKALTTAARSPLQRFEAGSLLGRLYREQGDLAHAIEWFERAAEVPAPAVDDGRALLYDLALALEEAGEISRALGVLLELQAEAGEYRDAAERTSRLTRAQAGG